MLLVATFTLVSEHFISFDLEEDFIELSDLSEEEDIEEEFNFELEWIPNNIPYNTLGIKQNYILNFISKRKFTIRDTIIKVPVPPPEFFC